jgi:hypothetical protein
MVTINTASHRLPQTYIEMQEECGKLLKLTEKLAAIARAKSEFDEDAEFQKLKKQIRERLQDEVIPRAFC